MTRRTAFKVGAGLSVAGAAGALGYQVVPPAPSAQLRRVDDLQAPTASLGLLRKA